MTEEAPTVRAIPTAQDRAAADMANMVRVLTAQRRHVEEIAQTRFALYGAYLQAGFDERQALELCAHLAI